MVNPQTVLLSLGAVILVGLLGSFLFARTKIPDVLLLIGVGILLGPILGFLDVGIFTTLIPTIATLTIIVIIFDAGLTLSLEHLARDGVRGVLLSFLAYVDAILFTVLILTPLVPMDLTTRVLLGVVLGSTGTSIVLSLVKGMHVGHRARTLTLIDTSLNDLYVIVGVVILATLLGAGSLDLLDSLALVGRMFLVGILLGAVFGVLLVQILGRLPRHPSQYLLTVAVLLLLYFVVERLGGAGILAVLMVGIAYANALVGSPAKPAGAAPSPWEWTPLFHRDLQVLQGEVFFFLRAFFFIALGVTLDLSLVTPEFLGISALLALGVFAGRYVAVSVCTAGTRLPGRDVFAIFILGPRGLTTAALASWPFYQFGLLETRSFPAYATGVVLLTNIITTLGVWARERYVARRPARGAAHDAHA